MLLELPSQGLRVKRGLPTATLSHRQAEAVVQVLMAERVPLDQAGMWAAQDKPIAVVGAAAQEVRCRLLLVKVAEVRADGLRPPSQRALQPHILTLWELPELLVPLARAE